MQGSRAFAAGFGNGKRISAGIMDGSGSIYPERTGYILLTGF